MKETKILTADQLEAINTLREAFGQEPIKPVTIKKPRTKLTTKLPKDWTEYDELKRIAYIMENRRFWKPIAVVSHTITQQCGCCKDEVTYIGNIFIRFKHVGTESLWDYQMPMSPEFSALPRAYFNELMQVQECASCFTSNTLQAANGHAPCECDTNFSHTCLWNEAQQLIAQGDLFMERPDAPRTPEAPKSAYRNSYPLEERGFGAAKSSLPRPTDEALDLRDKEQNSGSSLGGILHRALSA